MTTLSRRRALELLAAAGAAAVTGCTGNEPGRRRAVTSRARPTRATADPVISVAPLGFQWRTRDPFVFCVHHLDTYPPGNSRLGPPPGSLAGREIGRDFELRDGWRMYHGEIVPGFPRHPHRGFETVTVVRRGLLDHSDSLGATARYGGGDVQWLTAGRGIQHAEMFPLLDPTHDNPLELFQIWMNLPSANKMVAPHFSMLWTDSIPTREVMDEAGRAVRVMVVAGTYGDARAPAPPPRSWASESDSEVAIWTLDMDPGATWTLPSAARPVNRTLYFFRGHGLRVGAREIPNYHQVELRPDEDVTLAAGSDQVEILVLQGRPIGEPVVQRGPFVMNTEAEIRQAWTDYQRTQFGGWPWPSREPVHVRDDTRFARHADGRLDRPG